MSKSQAQQPTVTLVDAGHQYIEIIPATNKSAAQDVGAARAGDNQTIAIRAVNQ